MFGITGGPALTIAMVRAVTTSVAGAEPPTRAVAVMVALPALTPVTTPLLSTVATLGSEDDQVTEAFPTALPRASFASAAMVALPLTATRAVSGLVRSVATRWPTASVAVAWSVVAPSIAAVT